MSPKFLTALRVEDDGGFPFVLTGALAYDSALFPRPAIVPTGFRTDYASIPRLLWNVLPPVGKYDAAAVLHDYVYQTGTVADQDHVTRGEADALLNEAMTALGVSRFTRRIIYAGVRLGGWAVWAKYRAADRTPEVAA